LEGSPGADFDYNNYNTILLAMVLERVYETPLEELLSDKVWAPLGARDATMWQDRRRGMPRPFCCTFATAEDWARVGLLILDEGRVGSAQVVPSDHLRRMMEPSAANVDYGWQLWRAHRPGGFIWEEPSEGPVDPSTVFLFGIDEQKVYVLPDSGLIAVRVGEVPEDWDDSVIPNALARAVADVP